MSLMKRNIAWILLIRLCGKSGGTKIECGERFEELTCCKCIVRRLVPACQRLFECSSDDSGRSCVCSACVQKKCQIWDARNGISNERNQNRTTTIGTVEFNVDHMTYKNRDGKSVVLDRKDNVFYRAYIFGCNHQNESRNRAHTSEQKTELWREIKKTQTEKQKK